MNYLDYITSIINDFIKGAIPCDRSQVLGIAQSVRTVKNDKTVVWPAIYKSPEDFQYAGFDDLYSLVAYHRSLGQVAQRMPGGYGDGLGYIKLTNRVALVIYGNREELTMDSNQLAFLMQFTFPDKLTKEQLPKYFSSVLFNINDVVLTEEQVFNEEFKNVDYFLGPEHILLKCNYTIESMIDKRCFTTNKCRPTG